MLVVDLYIIVSSDIHSMSVKGGQRAYSQNKCL